MIKNWEKIDLGSIIELVSGQHVKTDNYNEKGEGIPYLTGPTDFVGDQIEPTKYTTQPKAKAEENDILLTVKGSGVGKLAYVNREYCISRQLMAIRPKTLETKFLFYYLQFSSRYFEKYARGLIPGISRDEVNNLVIKVPPKPERDKIVEIIDQWSKAERKLNHLIESVMRYKKGLMQQLLSGKNRFPEFVTSEEKFETKFGNYPSDWNYVKIRTFAEELKDRKSEEITDYTVLSCTKYDGLVDSLEYFDRQVFSDDLSNYKVVEKGSFAYATNHIEEGSIGYNDWCDVGLISPMYKVFKTDSKKVDDHFLYKFFKTEKYRHIFEINTNGTVNRRGSLRWRGFSNIKIPLPPLEEQNKISEVLQNAEKEIELLEQQLEAIKKQKKGLMQKLLTSKISTQKQNFVTLPD